MVSDQWSVGTIRGRGRGSVRVRVRDRGGVGLVVVALVARSGRAARCELTKHSAVSRSRSEIATAPLR